MPDNSTGERQKQFWEKEYFWFVTVVATAVVIFMAIMVGFLVVLFAGPLEQLTNRADPFYKLAIVGAGIVTFCTVVWRGLISARQADAQLKQIDRLAEQIKATEENNLAKLLQEGAQLIANTEHAAQVSAGIATLKSIATSPNGLFATEAMELLADFIQENYHLAEQEANLDSARSALSAAATRGRCANRTLYFQHDQMKGIYTISGWEIVYGVETLMYLGGTLNLPEKNESDPDIPRICCTDVTIRGIIDESIIRTLLKCRFENCRIKKTNQDELFYNEFKQCDFSGCTVDGFIRNPNFSRKDGNFFIEEPPSGETHNFDWTEILHDTPPPKEADTR